MMIDAQSWAQAVRNMNDLRSFMSKECRWSVEWVDRSRNRMRLTHTPSGETVYREFWEISDMKADSIRREAARMEMAVELRDLVRTFKALGA